MLSRRKEVEEEEEEAEEEEDQLRTDLKMPYLPLAPWLLGSTTPPTNL
jgi:hypothetical protein